MNMLFLPLLTSLFWAISPYFFSIAQSKIGVNQLNVDRLLIAAVALGCIIALTGVNVNISVAQCIFLVLSGLFGLVCGDYFLFSSYGKIGPRYSMLMMSLAPVFSCIGAAIIFDEHIGIVGLLGIVITITGIAIVVSRRSKSLIDETINITPKKLLFGILAALGQSVGLLCVKQAYMLGTLSGISATFVRISSASIISMVWLSIIKKYSNPIVVYKQNVSALKYVLLGTLFGPILGVTTSIITLEYIPVSIAQTLFSTSPIFMLLISHFIIKDKITIRATIGVIITLIGVGVLML